MHINKQRRLESSLRISLLCLHALVSTACANLGNTPNTMRETITCSQNQLNLGHEHTSLQIAALKRGDYLLAEILVNPVTNRLYFPEIPGYEVQNVQPTQSVSEGISLERIVIVKFGPSAVKISQGYKRQSGEEIAQCEEVHL